MHNASRFSRYYKGRLIPIMRGGDPVGDAIFPDAPDDFAAFSDDELEAFITDSSAAAKAVGADPSAYVTDERTPEALLAEMQAGMSSLRAARDELKNRTAAPEEPEEPEGEPEAVEAAGDPEEFAAVAELAALADEPVEPEPAVEPVTAAAPPADPAVAPAPLPKPAQSRRATAPRPAPIALTAAAGGFGLEVGEAFGDPIELARVMEDRRRQFGIISEGTSGEKVPVARASWVHIYEQAGRKLSQDFTQNKDVIDRVIDPELIKQAFQERRDAIDAGKLNALTASGGLCAPVTPYYQLMMVAVADRPVRAALPSFNADRGGIRFATPATLASITTGVGLKTAAQDAAGGTTATKTCQTVACPPFSEVDVDIIWHCLTFGNLGARTFPERVAQWNNLVLAQHARIAETLLLDGIANASTAVLASNLGLGASATLPSQVLAAAAGMRSRHRMDDNAVLRVMFPMWVLDLLVSDVYRSQFDRFDMTKEDFVRVLRAANVEPSFFKDSPTGGAQVFGAQSAGALLPFPPTVEWFLFPEGSFLYLDGGTLELGLVRDSVLNSTNDFQIFGEGFENIAFVGVESLAIRSTVCDTGAVSLPKSVTTCVYT